jgi:hypothetical protein
MHNELDLVDSRDMLYSPWLFYRRYSRLWRIHKRIRFDEYTEFRRLTIVFAERKSFFTERTRLLGELFKVMKILGCDFGELVCLSVRIMGVVILGFRAGEDTCLGMNFDHLIYEHLGKKSRGRRIEKQGVREKRAAE